MSSHRVLRGLLLAFLALVGGTVLVLLLAGPASAASPPTAPELLGEVLEDVDDGAGAIADVPEAPPEQATPLAASVHSVTERTGDVLEHAPQSVRSVASVAEEAPDVAQALHHLVDTVPIQGAPSVMDAVPALVQTVENVVRAAPGMVTAVPNVIDAAPGFIQSATDVIAGVGAVADEIVSETPLAELVPSAEKLVSSASSNVTETVIDSLLDQPEPAEAVIEPLQPLPMPAIEPPGDPVGTAGTEPTARLGGVHPGPALTSVSSVAGWMLQLTGFEAAPPNSASDTFESPEILDAQAALPSAPYGPDGAPPLGSSGASSGGFSSNAAALDACGLTVALHVASSHPENDDVPGTPTYDSDTTPD